MIAITIAATTDNNGIRLLDLPVTEAGAAVAAGAGGDVGAGKAGVDIEDAVDGMDEGAVDGMDVGIGVVCNVGDCDVDPDRGKYTVAPTSESANAMARMVANNIFLFSKLTVSGSTDWL